MEGVATLGYACFPQRVVRKWHTWSAVANQEKPERKECVSYPSEGVLLKILYRARYYNPTLQRFISEDPLAFDSGDVNFYAYVRNDPSESV